MHPDPNVGPLWEIPKKNALYSGYLWVIIYNPQESLENTIIYNNRPLIKPGAPTSAPTPPEAPFGCLGRFRHEASLELGVAAPQVVGGFPKKLGKPKPFLFVFPKDPFVCPKNPGFSL